MKKVFTTGQIAKICRVAPRTVSKWFDNGRLGGYRIPDSKDRRVPLEDLIRFLRTNHMPLGELASPVIMLVGMEPGVMGVVEQQLGLISTYSRDEIELLCVPTAIHAALELGSKVIDLAVIDLATYDWKILAHALRQRDAQTVLIGLANEDDPDPESHKRQGLKEVFRKPFDPMLLVESMISILSTRAS